MLLVPCNLQPKSPPIFAVRNRLRRRLLAAALVLLLTGSARALDVATTSALRSNGWHCAPEKRVQMVGILALTEGDYLLCGGFALALAGAVCLLWRRQLQSQQRALQKLRDEMQEEARLRTADLAKSVSALNAALESTADGLLVVDLEGRVVSYNRKFLQMWRIPPEKITSGRDDELVEIALDQVKDRRAVGEKIRELYGQPDLECCDLVELKDERILERYSIPQRLGGKIVGRVWSFRDVTEQKRIEREMAESRNFLDRIINSIGDPIHVKDRQHRWVLVNDAACSFLGLARQDILGKTEREVFPQAEAEAMWETDERVFETGNENVTERKLVDQAGKPSTLISKKNLYVDDKGQAFMVGVVQNITERVFVETELRWKTAFLEALVASSIDGLLVVNDAGRKVFQNQQLSDLWQIPREVAEDPDDSRQIQFVMKRVKAAEQFVSQVKYLYDHPDETSHDEIELVDDTILDRHSYPVVGQDGTRYGRIWQFRDVTEQKRIAREMAESRNFLGRIINSIGDPILVKDRQHRCVLVNDAACSFMGLARGDMLGKTEREILPQAEAEAIWETDERVFETGNENVTERKLVNQAGKPSTLISKKNLYVDDKGQAFIVGIIQNITERVFVETELRWKTAFLEALVASSIDGILVVNDAGRKVFQNQRLSDLWQIPPEVAEDRDASRQIQYVTKRVKAADQFVSQIKYLYDHPDEASHDEIELIDDKILDRHSYPIVGQDGTRYGRIWQFRDATKRKHAEAELAYERDLLRALLNSAPDAIYFKDRQSRFLRCSRSMASKFQVGKIEDLIGKTDFDFFTEEHARLAFEDEQRIIRTGEPLVAKIEQEKHIDGRITWALTNKMAFRNVKGEIIGTLGISNDITPIKDAEAKLNTAHRRLLEVSRQAGMAEVATSVLHNVGNVLNSINVSVSVIADAVRQSRVSSVELLSALIQEHRADLASFFTTHPKGKQVLDYLPVLAASLRAEQAALVKEVEHMRKNIEHVKDIVMMQQSYAKVSGVTERVKVVELVEDALRMNSGSMIRHDVEVIRDYAPNAPEIIVERHKVLQILVNLIRNAKFACDESGRTDKRVTVRIGNRGGRVEISVADNGIGILPENMTRIFNHGFTTRKHGHGFGLHSGALAAREIGGALTAHSDGPGTGALFTLELPLEPPGGNKLAQSDAGDLSVRE